MTTTSPYRLLTIVQDQDHFFCIPVPQVLGMKFHSPLNPTPAKPSPFTPADTIELRLSVARLTLRGVGLSAVWSDLVSGKHTVDPTNSMESLRAQSNIVCRDIELIGRTTGKPSGH